jgi:hypothetical protein
MATSLRIAVRSWSRALERIDRAFVSKEWDGLYPHNDLHSLTSIFSDHAPAPEDRQVFHIQEKISSLWFLALVPGLFGNGGASLALSF